MDYKIVMTEDIFDEIKESLEWDGRERMVYLLCHSSQHLDSIKIMPYKVIVPTEEDYVSRSVGHFVMRKGFASKVFIEALENQSHVIEFHEHPPEYPGMFSPVDNHHEPIIMRHVAEQISGMHLGAMVISHDFSELDAHFYDRELDDVVPVDKVIVVGKEDMKLFIPTGIQSAVDVVAPRMDRTVKVYGKDAVAMVRNLDIGIIGASGLGSPAIEMIAMNSPKSILICDPDVISESNLNRLVGASPEDVGKSKSEFYAERVSRINPDVQVTYFDKSFYESEVQAAFSQRDVLLGCVDSGAGLSASRLSVANLIPYFDMGAGIVREENKVNFKGGQIFSVLPGRDVCLECSGVFKDLETEYWSPEKREREREQGYLNDSEVVNPLVADLDFVIAGLGVNAMLSYIWGQGTEPHFKLYCDMAKGKITQSESSSDGCIFCMKDGLLGNGDKVGYYVPNDNSATIGGTI